MGREMNGDSKQALAGLILLLATLVATGCGRSSGTTASVDPEPFKKAIADYLERNNMAMALKEIKQGPLVEGDTATLTASLTHATLAGPAVTWEIHFEKDRHGSWRAVSHK